MLQIHYHPDGKPETDQSAVGIYFHASTPAQKIVAGIAVRTRKLDIPPGAALSCLGPERAVAGGCAGHRHRTAHALHW